MTAPAALERARYINDLVRKATPPTEDRAALAALRRGLGKSPAEATEAHRYVLPFLPDGAPVWDEEMAYLVGGLFALHPSDERNRRGLGGAFAHLARQFESADSIERRFLAVLSCDRTDLPHRLRQAISLLRAHDVPVDYLQLLDDLLAWNHPDRPVQRRWARQFWGGRAATEAAAERAAGAVSQAADNNDANKGETE